jgi:hypothetical protein
MEPLTPEQVERLRSFKGYGPHLASRWFVRMEEGLGDANDEEALALHTRPFFGHDAISHDEIDAALLGCSWQVATWTARSRYDGENSAVDGQSRKKVKKLWNISSRPPSPHSPWPLARAECTTPSSVSRPPAVTVAHTDACENRSRHAEPRVVSGH